MQHHPRCAERSGHRCGGALPCFAGAQDRCHVMAADERPHHVGGHVACFHHCDEAHERHDAEVARAPLFGAEILHADQPQAHHERQRQADIRHDECRRSEPIDRPPVGPVARHLEREEGKHKEGERARSPAEGGGGGCQVRGGREGLGPTGGRQGNRHGCRPEQPRRHEQIARATQSHELVDTADRDHDHHGEQPPRRRRAGEPGRIGPDETREQGRNDPGDDDPVGRGARAHDSASPPKRRSRPANERIASSRCASVKSGQHVSVTHSSA